MISFNIYCLFYIYHILAIKLPTQELHTTAQVFAGTTEAPKFYYFSHRDS